MNRAAYSLKLPLSVKAAATRLAREDGVSPDQWICLALAEKIALVETASDFPRRRSGAVRPGDMLPYLDDARCNMPVSGDEY